MKRPVELLRLRGCGGGIATDRASLAWIGAITTGCCGCGRAKTASHTGQRRSSTEQAETAVSGRSSRRGRLSCGQSRRRCARKFCRWGRSGLLPGGVVDVSGKAPPSEIAGIETSPQAAGPLASSQTYHFGFYQVTSRIAFFDSSRCTNWQFLPTGQCGASVSSVAAAVRRKLHRQHRLEEHLTGGRLQPFRTASHQANTRRFIIDLAAPLHCWTPCNAWHHNVCRRPLAAGGNRLIALRHFRDTEVEQRPARDPVPRSRGRHQHDVVWREVAVKSKPEDGDGQNPGRYWRAKNERRNYAARSVAGRVLSKFTRKAAILNSCESMAHIRRHRGGHGGGFGSRSIDQTRKRSLTAETAQGRAICRLSSKRSCVGLRHCLSHEAVDRIWA